MKNDWANSPQKIVLHIIQYLSQDSRYRKQLQHLQLINRNWGKAARRTFYEVVSLHWSEKQVAALLQTLEFSKNKLLSQAVRKISLDLKASPEERNLCALIEICPNVTETTTPSFGCKLNYYFYSLLSELHKEGYLQHLENVTAPDPTFTTNDQSLITKYEDTMLSSAATATELHIGSKSEVAGGLTGLFPTVANHLADFASLKKLEINVSHEIPFNEVYNLLVDNQPPQLNGFELSSSSSMPSVIYPANDICGLSQVGRVLLQLHVFSAQDLCFIMRMFPNLKKKTIYRPIRTDNLLSTKLEIWSLVMSSEVLLKLVVSLEEFNELNDIRIYLTYIGVVDEVDLKVGGSMKEGYTCDGQDKAPCDLDIYLDFEAAYHLRLTKILLAGTTDYILAHCTTLNRLSLGWLEIDFSANGITINQLDKLDLSCLGLDNFQVSLDAYSYISQRIRQVGVFEVSERAHSGEYDSDFEAVQIDMPYTVFHPFIYANEWRNFAVKVSSYTKTAIFRVSNEKKIQRPDDSSPYV